MTQQYGAGTSALFPSGITGWHLKTNSPSQSFNFLSIVKNALGYFIPASKTARGKRTEISETWEPDGDESDACVVKLGSAGTVSCVDRAQLECANSGRPQLTVSGHRHDEKEAADGAHESSSYDFEFVMPTGAYGAVNPFGGDSIAGLNDYEIQRSTQTASIGHVDETGATGKFLYGVARGVKLEASLTACTAAVLAIAEDNGGWLIRSKSEPQSNEGLRKVTLDGEMYVDESAT